MAFVHVKVNITSNMRVTIASNANRMREPLKTGEGMGGILLVD